MGKLEGKIAIVTGAGQGIGQAVSHVLAKAGVAIAVVEIKRDTAKSTVDEITASGGRALSVICDVSKREQVNAAVSATVKAFGTVDILVNLAQGSGYSALFEDVTDEQIKTVWGPAFYGTFYFMQACFPYMKEHGGKVINVGSVSGLQGDVGQAAYAANKEAVRSLTRVAAHEWGKYRINVNAFCPSALTPTIVEWFSKFPGQYDALVQKSPMGRFGDPDKDIAPVVLFLAGPDSDFITGMTIMVDGGQYVLR